MSQPHDVTSAREARRPGGAGYDPGVFQTGAGLRLRLWIGCLAGAVAGAAAVLAIAWAVAPTDPLFNPVVLGIWPWSAAGACIVVGVAVALWLDHAIVTHLRGVVRALHTGNLTELRGLPASSGWGQLSVLTQQVQSLIARHREVGRVALELEDLRHRIRALRQTVEARASGERAEPLKPVEGVLGPLIEALNRHWESDTEALLPNREAAAALTREAAQVLGEARASAGEAERGFVEATALLTTVRELQRLGGELQLELAAGPEPADRPDAWDEAQRRWREAAAAAIEELVTSSSVSVEHLAAGLLKVQEIGDQVHVLANRATLLALDAVMASGRGEEPAADLKALAREVRELTDRTTRLTREIDAEVTAAVQGMQGVRDRVADKLDEAPPAPAAPARAGEQAVRLLERVREMVQDAAAKGERLSASSESVSRAAERLVRRLEEEIRELERLATGLGASEEDVHGTPPAPVPTGWPGNLTLLGPEDVAPGELPEDGAEERS